MFESSLINPVNLKLDYDATVSIGGGATLTDYTYTAPTDGLYVSAIAISNNNSLYINDTLLTTTYANVGDAIYTMFAFFLTKGDKIRVSLYQTKSTFTPVK